MRFPGLSAYITLPAENRSFTDCVQDGCGQCDVCKYLAFLEWAEAAAPPEAFIQRDAAMDNYLRATYPDEK